MRRRLLPISLLLAWLRSRLPAGIVQDVLASFATGSDARAIQAAHAPTAPRKASRPSTSKPSAGWRAPSSKAATTPPPRNSRRAIYAQSTELLKKRPLDREPHLPLALGAAIEVQGGVARRARPPQRSRDLSCRNRRRPSAPPPSSPRIRKNLLLLTLEGKPAPPLDGVTRSPGKPALVFFWAHWCPDCKAEIPILANASKPSSRRRAWCSSRPRRSTATWPEASTPRPPSRPPTSNRCAARITRSDRCPARR